MSRSLSESLRDRPLLFEPVPPSSRTSATRSKAHLEELVKLIETIPRVDAIDVPELVDENHDGKPFYRSSDVRVFGRTLADRIGREVIVNKIVAYLPSLEAVSQWARETVERGVRHVVLVGGSSRYIPYPGPPVIEANRHCQPIVQHAGGLLGNISIPQRTGEAHRMLAKTRAGASFFTTQILFDSEGALRMLREYDTLCRGAGIRPASVLLSVAPLVDEGDAEFVRWLGADIPESAERSILNGEEKESAARSVVHALRVFGEVRAGVAEGHIGVPVGVNVEEITQRHLAPAAEMLSAFAKVIDDIPAH
ncbi:MAG: hypothetical protein L3K09_03635 [Thermoplasmata archaeon]|nr:hypothetical protein [Thermoplasmata archaeon]